jgi:hypothetical protein
LLKNVSGVTTETSIPRQRVQKPTPPRDNKKIVVNLSEVRLEEAAGSALSKGVNYAVAPAFVPVKDILCGVQKAIGALPEETAEEIRQETVRILRGSRKPKDNLTGAERRALRALKPMRHSPSFRLTRVMRPWYWVLQTTTRRSLLSWRTRPTRS